MFLIQKKRSSFFCFYIRSTQREVNVFKNSSTVSICEKLRFDEKNVAISVLVIGVHISYNLNDSNINEKNSFLNNNLLV